MGLPGKSSAKQLIGSTCLHSRCGYLPWQIMGHTPDECRYVRCCDETGHKPGVCVGTVATRFWTFRWEYYCAHCREYGWCGSKTRGYIPRSSPEPFCLG